MVCLSCGTAVAAGVNFCPRCGAQMANTGQPVYSGPPPVAGHYGTPAPMLVARPRVQSHLQALGVLWCVFAAYRIVTALIGMIVLKAFTMRGFGGWGWPMHGRFDSGWESQQGWLAFLLPVIAVATAVSAVLAIFVGYSLLQRKPLGRILAIVVAVLTLLKFPMGTALGIYTLWVLAPAASGAEWEAIADRS